MHAFTRRLLITVALSCFTACGDDKSISPDTTADTSGPDASQDTVSDATDASEDTTADTSGDASDASPDSLTIATFCTSFATRLCDGLSDCNCERIETCLHAQTTACEVGLSSYIGGVTLGDLTFLSETCRIPSPRYQPLACNTFLTDPAPLGSTCSAFGRGLRCAEGTGFCNRETGACEALSTEGACDSRSRCADDRTCDGGKCVVPASAGAACASDVGCELGLVCRVDNTCGTPGERGADCLYGTQCGEDLACVDGKCADALALGSVCTNEICGPAGMCVAPDARTCEALGQVGDTCGGRETDCAAGLTCDFTKSIPTCIPLPQLDEACPTGSCAAGLTCDYEVSLCKKAPGLNEACLNSTSRPCAEGLGCASETTTCVPAGGDGEPCVGLGNTCLDGFKCDDSATPPTCRPPGDAGAPCGWDDTRCKPGLFCDTTVNTCAATLALGATCDRDSACGLTGRCDFSTEKPVCVEAPSTIGESCDWMCGNGLRCAPAKGECIEGACAFLR